MKSMTFTTGSVLAGLVAIGLTMAVPAQGSILVDFGNNTSFRGVSVATPDSNGNYWNSIQPGLFIVDMVDNNNTATTLDLGFSTAVGTDSFNGPAGPTTVPTAGEIALTDIDALALGDLGIKTAAIDFAAGAGGLVRFEIQELDPTKLYDLTLYGSHKFNSDATTVYSIYTDNTYSTLVDTASLDVHQPGSPWLHNRDTVATISGVAPQASNILYVEFVGSLGGDGYLNSMKIDVVPEPGTLAMFLMGGILMAVRRNRR